MLRAAGTGSAPRLLAASAVAVSTTGNVTENVLATITIPAGAMGANGGLHIYTTWSYTNSANSKTLRVRLGGAAGTQFMTLVPNTTGLLADFRRIRNRNSASSQVGSIAAGATAYVSTTSSLVTSTVDTSVAVDLVISGQLALGTETITLETYEVWLVP